MGGYCLCSQSREILQIKGIVTNEADKPIYGVHCYLKNNDHFGKISDTLGVFHISAPNSTFYDTLILSIIGYEKKEIPLSSLNANQDTLLFKLSQQSVFLDEITVETEGYELKELVLKSFARMPKIYPNKAHQLKGLYRKVSTEGIHYTKIEEAAITIDDYHYKRMPADIKISTQAFRESKDWGKIDTFYTQTRKKINESLAKRFGNSPNPLYRLYEKNYIRLYNKHGTYFNLKTMSETIDDYFRFELMDISILDGDTIYQIAFEEGITPPISRPTGQSFFKINMADLAIIEWQFIPTFPIKEEIHVKFQKIDGRYYPKYIKWKYYRFINQNIEDEEFDIQYFWFDEVNTGKFKNIRLREANDREKMLSYKKSLDTTFWRNTELLNDHPANKAMMKDLNEHEPLENQFKAATKEK